MVIIHIDGEIGWDVTAESIREQLAGVPASEEVVAHIGSPGGLISEGLKIYNELKNWPGTVNTHLVGVVASMATYIAMVGEHRTAEKNAVFMIHNGRMAAIGDHRVMFWAGKHLDSLSNMIAKEYAAKTGIELVDLRTAMDDETFYYGDEIQAAGFVHEMVGDEDGDPENKTEALATAQLMINECQAKVTEPATAQEDIQVLATMLADDASVPDDDSGADSPEMKITGFDKNAKLKDEKWDKAASETRWRNHVGVKSADDLPSAAYDKRFVYIDNPKSLTARNFPIFDYKGGEEFVNISAVRNGLARLSQSSIPAADKERVKGVLNKYLDKFKKQEKQEAETMTIEELRKEHPDLVAQLIEEGRAAGVQEERDRVKGLTEMRGRFTKDYSHKVIDQAIIEGHDLSTVSINLQAAEQTAAELEDEEDNDTTTDGGAGGDDDAPEMKDGIMTHPDHVDVQAQKIGRMVGLVKPAAKKE